MICHRPFVHVHARVCACRAMRVRQFRLTCSGVLLCPRRSSLILSPGSSPCSHGHVPSRQEDAMMPWSWLNLVSEHCLCLVWNDSPEP